MIEAVRGVPWTTIPEKPAGDAARARGGRSELPGRPWMFGTTQKFMEHSA
jgi:chromosome segregation and condensation protein ScpB